MTATASACSITIPPEIITEIMYHVPAKSVGRFRCVSKDWLSQLSSLQFIKNHHKTLNRNHLIYVSPADYFSSSELFTLDHHGKTPKKCDLNARSITIHGSCNGLVLVSIMDKVGDDRVLVLNPTTKELKTLPKCIRYELIKDIKKKHIRYGFGYDSLTDDYKFVTFNPQTRSTNINIYSPKSNNTCARVGNFLKDYSYIVDSPGVYVNGFLHWLAKKRSDGLGVILAFNLVSENFKELASPDVDIVDDVDNVDDIDIVDNSQCCKLVGINGKLAIVVRNEGQVWLMNEYGVKESWTDILNDGNHEFRTLLRTMISNKKSGYLEEFADTEGRRYSENVDFCRALLLINHVGFTESLVSPNLRNKQRYMHQVGTEVMYDGVTGIVYGAVTVAAGGRDAADPQHYNHFKPILTLTLSHKLTKDFFLFQNLKHNMTLFAHA
ncbi:F-box/kelch-repeat protein At3g06240-like [Rutidosis leptorrhynchoides]|uniref:F-box/kelch-repeat protein At3g06240-like n=1 Tax=Rutidosis leptorrhynchoides TaxID=125765 RepID=UPI003A991E9D